jgi:hypothetical protein
VRFSGEPYEDIGVKQRIIEEAHERYYSSGEPVYFKSALGPERYEGTTTMTGVASQYEVRLPLTVVDCIKTHPTAAIKIAEIPDKKMSAVFPNFTQSIVLIKDRNVASDMFAMGASLRVWPDFSRFDPKGEMSRCAEDASRQLMQEADSYEADVVWHYAADFALAWAKWICGITAICLAALWITQGFASRT